MFSDPNGLYWSYCGVVYKYENYNKSGYWSFNNKQYSYNGTIADFHRAEQDLPPESFMQAVMNYENALPIPTMSHITYCTQVPAIKKYFKKDDWGKYDYKNGCAVACTVMSFSTLGFSIKPKDVCAWNGGTVFMNFSTAAAKKKLKVENRRSANGPYSYKEIKKRIDKYRNNPTKYGPLIILLPTSIRACHYIILTGYTKKNTYYFIDPEQDIDKTKKKTWSIPNARQMVQFYK